MPRGGRRQPRPGGLYPNRSDLAKGPTQPARAATGQQYGAAGAQIASQNIIPLPQGTSPAPTPPVNPPPAPLPGNPPSQPGAGGAPPRILPGELTPLDAPTQRPDEPVTAGAPFGLGAGPSGGSTIADQLRALYRLDPNDDLGELIELYDLGIL